MLADAFAIAAVRDEQLAKALAPTLERATRASIRKDPRTLVGILYPVVGPAIRKSVAEAIEGTLQRLNRALKHSFSLQGLRWRLEALRSGTNFADVVLKHTVVFRVEHVFLIHRKTGLLLEHVAAEEVTSQDPQLVSGMLTAIQDFVRDSFDGDQKGGGGIDTLRLGDLLLWCEEGPYAYLAAVIRGNPPEALHAELRETLTAIHAEMGGALEEFDGDNAALGDLTMPLQQCLRQQEQAPRAKPKQLSRWLWAVPIVLAIAVGAWTIPRAIEQRRFDDYVERLRDEPGVVVTSGGAPRQMARLGLARSVGDGTGGAARGLAARPDAHRRSLGTLSGARPGNRREAARADVSSPAERVVVRRRRTDSRGGQRPGALGGQARALIAAQPAGSTPVTSARSPTFWIRRSIGCATRFKRTSSRSIRTHRGPRKARTRCSTRSPPSCAS